jgi:hypothetical protein
MKEMKPPKFVRDQMEAVLDLQTEAEIAEEEAHKLEEEIRRMEADLDECQDTEEEEDSEEEETDEESDDELEDEDEEEDVENEVEETDEEDEEENDWRGEYEAQEETQEEKDGRENSGGDAVVMQAARNTRNRFIKDVLVCSAVGLLRLNPQTDRHPQTDGEAPATGEDWPCPLLSEACTSKACTRV